MATVEKEQACFFSAECQNMISWLFSKHGFRNIDLKRIIKDVEDCNNYILWVGFDMLPYECRELWRNMRNNSKLKKLHPESYSLLCQLGLDNENLYHTYPYLCPMISAPPIH